MKVYDRDSLSDELVARYDLDIGDIDSYFKMYDVDVILEKLNTGKITVDSLYDGMAQWLGIANIFESKEPKIIEINENTTFREYLVESGFTLEQYKEDVYNACLKLDDRKYRNIDLYFYEEIEEAFKNQVPVNKIAAQIAAEFDTMVSKVDEIELDEPDDEYTPEQLKAFANYPQDRFEEDEDYDEKENEFVDKYDFSNDYLGESTEANDNGVSDGASYDEWKVNVFKYLDKRIDVNKIKELGTYIKDFVKQEYDKGEPSWFVAAESIVNYARINYPSAVKPRESNAFNITEKYEPAKVYIVEFETEDDARENEFEMRDNCGSMVDTAILGTKLYLLPTEKGGETIINDWYGDKVKVLVGAEATDVIDSTFMDESVEPKQYTGYVEFVSEDAAYDAMDIWKNVLEPQIRFGSLFDPWTQKLLKTARRMKPVTVDKTSATRLTITAPKKVLVKEAIAIFNEDEDSVRFSKVE